MARTLSAKRQRRLTPLSTGPAAALASAGRLARTLGDGVTDCERAFTSEVVTDGGGCCWLSVAIACARNLDALRARNLPGRVSRLSVPELATARRYRSFLRSPCRSDPSLVSHGAPDHWARKGSDRRSDVITCVQGCRCCVRFLVGVCDVGSREGWGVPSLGPGCSRHSAGNRFISAGSHCESPRGSIVLVRRLTIRIWTPPASSPAFRASTDR